MNDYPILYKVDSKGKVREWRVWICAKTIPGVIYVEHGQKNGKKQLKKTYIRTGKNLGKLNETSILEQCDSEAKSKWNKQKDKGYSETIPNEKPFSPMLAHRFDKFASKIKYPAYLQCKLDGARFTVTLENDKVVGRSRVGKSDFQAEHILKSLTPLLEKNRRIVLDGELFTRELTFQEILSAIKRDTPNELTGKIEYWIYDLYHRDQPKFPFHNRLSLLRGIKDIPHVRVVNTYEVTSEQDVFKWHKKNVEEGFEGSIVRNFDGVYKFSRSYDLQKVKDFQDEEFKIVGMKLDKNGECVFSCVTQDQEPFDVKCEGSHQERVAYYNKDNIGKMLNVRFFEWTTSEHPCPRFPVGTRVRDNDGT